MIFLNLKIFSDLERDVVVALFLFLMLKCFLILTDNKPNLDFSLVFGI